MAGTIVFDSAQPDGHSFRVLSNTGTTLLTANTNAIVCTTAGTERMRIDSVGNIFANASALYVPTHASTANIDFKVGASLNTSFRIQSTGRLYNSIDSDVGTNYRSTLYPGTLCRAWVLFNGTGTGTFTPTSSFNVSNITKNATGDWTVNFVNAMPDANYAASIASSPNYGVNIGNFNQYASTATSTESAPTTSAFRFAIIGQNSNALDAKYISVIFFR